MTDNRDADERQPLLSHGAAAAGEAAPEVSPQVSPEITASPSSSWPPSSSSSSPFVNRLRQYVYIPHLTNRQSVQIQIIFALFVAAIGVHTTVPALSSMLESILCRRILVADDPSIHLPVNPHFFGPNPLANDPRCKDNAVQHELSRISGWLTSIESIPSILLTIPYGVMADKVGRRPVILLAWLGLTLQLLWYLISLTLATYNLASPWIVLFSAVISFIGNFQAVGPAMIYTVAADVTPQADRASYYFRLQAGFLGAELISNPLGGALLLIDNWTPLIVGFGLTAASALSLLLFLPETLNFDQAADCVPKTIAQGDDDESDNNNGDSTGDDRIESFPPPAASYISRAWYGFLHFLENDASELWRFILMNRRLMVLVFSFSFLIAGKLAQELLLQYSTKRYMISWGAASFLLTIRSISNLVTCLLILPAISIFCVRRLGLPPLFKDLWLARVSGVLFVVGALITAFANNIPVLCVALVVSSLGSGFGAFMRSLLNAFVEPHHQAILNSMLSLVEFGGVMIAAPLMYKMLSKGLELGGIWVGLPFMVAAVMFLVGNLMVWAFQIPAAMVAPAVAEEDVEEGEGGASLPVDARAVDQEA